MTPAASQKALMAAGILFREVFAKRMADFLFCSEMRGGAAVLSHPNPKAHFHI
jgi:hypothetical protein